MLALILAPNAFCGNLRGGQNNLELGLQKPGLAPSLKASTHIFCIIDATYADDNMARYLLWLQALLSVAIAAQLYTCAAGQYHTEVSRALPDSSSAIALFLL